MNVGPLEGDNEADVTDPKYVGVQTSDENTSGEKSEDGKSQSSQEEQPPANHGEIEED